MTASSRTTRILAAIGAAFLIFSGISLAKFTLALKYESNFAAALVSAPPRLAFSNKVFWITGASSGIGRALAMHLCSAHDDVKLILSSRRKNVLQEVATECKKKGNGADVKVLPVDLADHSSLKSKAKQALSMYGGRIDVLVNNGGITTRSMARNANFDVDAFVTDVDFLSYVGLTKALIPSWEESQSGDDDSKPIIINTSSVAGRFGVPVRAAYSGAKHAIMGWFDAFRIEQILAGYPINVLNVVLGSTRTNVARNAVTESPDKKFGDGDKNIESGLDAEFVVERVLASAYAGQNEIWIAPKKELLALYLFQYIPETANKIFLKSSAKQYAVEKEKEKPEDKEL